MSDFYLRKDELDFIERKLRKNGFSWEEINKRKDKIKGYLKKLVLKIQKKNKRELTNKEDLNFN